MYWPCYYNDKETIFQLIKNGNTDWDNGLCGACAGGHKDLALLMIEKGADDWNRGLIHSCYRGHKGLALLMIGNGINDWNWALKNACLGHKELALLMIEKGANEWNQGSYSACRGDAKDANIDICLLELDEFDIDYLLDKKVKEFGKYQDLAFLRMGKRYVADKVFKELNLRDIDSVIHTY